MRAAIYARVSTSDQTCSLQLRELRTYVKARGWKVAAEYVDTGWSGAKASRPELDRLMQDARERKVDVILVWKLDRWGRSVQNLVGSLQELHSLGVRWIATTQGLDTDESSPVGRLLIHMLSAIAEFERALAQERIKAGMAAAIARGVRVGRPCKVFRRDRALELRGQGWSLRAIARELRVPVMTVQRAVPPTAPSAHPPTVPKPRKSTPHKTTQKKH
jgi:putative DNA-invertase from lambdoid prophage Rac